MQSPMVDHDPFYSLKSFIEGEEKERQRLSRELHDGIGRISNNLMPSVLEAFGIVFAIRNLCVETSEHTGLKIFLDFKGDFESLNKTIKTYIFRIAQEALNNTVKHARASRVELVLIRQKDDVLFKIHDDGKGFNLQEIQTGTGHGMNNMRERVNLLNGSIDIDSHVNEGTQITINIPLFQ